ncbi:MAG: hypothetical protein M1817_005148 [Caeruleum heppii]|nr:MAG: hypothetical protein M1817_005148 [Caeruleum heppii]
MTFVPYAGFDPIFWLHHMNVDRLFAIFQAICPNTYVVPQNGEDVNTPLTPFRRNNAGAIYTSVTARGTRPFGYSYPEVVDWGFTAAQVTRNTRARVRSLYCSSSSTASNAGAERRDVEGYTVSNALKAGGSPAGKYREWYINLQVDKNELGTGFFVHFFLGNFADNPQTWSFDATLVGTHGVFTPNNTVEAPTAIVYAQIPLTRKLIDSFNRGSIANLELAAVGPYLRQNLAWRVQKYDDRGVPTAQLSTLKIYIVDAEVTPGSGPDDLPTYGTYTPHADITRGKQGGWNDDRPPGQ